MQHYRVPPASSTRQANLNDRPSSTYTALGQHGRSPSCFAAPRSKTISHANKLNCEHIAECSGCSFDAADVASPPSIRIARGYFQSLGYCQRLDFHVGSVHAWRYRARLAVRRIQSGGGSGVAIGLFREGTHDVVSIPGCKAHHPLINEATQLFLDCITSSNILPYDETTGKGQLRYVQFTVVEADRVEGVQVECLLVWNARPTEPTDQDLIKLSSRLYNSSPTLIHSVHVNFQPEKGNVIFGQHTRHLCGARESWVRVGGLSLALHPGSFMQANPNAMEEAIKDIRSWTPDTCRLVDLHAGVGTIALSLAAAQLNVSSLTLVEINPMAESVFWKSWERLTETSKFNFKPEYHVAAAESSPGTWLQEADMVVVDPPRKGLDAKLLDYLCEVGPRKRVQDCETAALTKAPQSSISRLAYLSCGWKAFARDCRALVSSGSWKLRYAKAYWFFPGTDHLEILAIFDRL